MTELDRIRTEFERRDADPGVRTRNALDAPAHRAVLASRAAAAVEMLSEVGLAPGPSLRVLDAGCGAGNSSEPFAAAGADVWGVDLLPARLEAARVRFPGARLAAADAGRLPFADGAFDVCLLFTVLTSIRDGDLRARVAAEAARVVRPGGAVLVYDLRVPRGAARRGLSRRAARILFSDGPVRVRALTPPLPVLRRMGTAAEAACARLERLPLLCTHHLLLIRPERSHA